MGLRQPASTRDWFGPWISHCIRDTWVSLCVASLRFATKGTALLSPLMQCTAHGYDDCISRYGVRFVQNPAAHNASHKVEDHDHD